MNATEVEGEAPQSGDQTTAALQQAAPPPPEHARYDVFLCHNSLDKPLVKDVADALQLEAGILFFLDEFSIPPSVEFLEFIRSEMTKSASCAIFLGASGWGKTQLVEAQLALGVHKQRPEFRIIPVNLSGVAEDGWEALFGTGQRPPFNWIPLKNATDDDGKTKLIEAIHGKFLVRAAGPEAVTPYYIRRQAALWDRSGRRDNSTLLAGRMLREAQAVAAANPEFVTVNAVPAFLQRCVQRERSLLRSIVAASITAAIVAGALALLAYSQRNEAIRQRQVAEENGRISQTRSLASIALRSIGEDRADERALLLSRQAYLLDRRTDGKSSSIVTAALSEILATPYLSSVLQLPPHKVLDQVSPSGTFLLLGTMEMGSDETKRKISLLGPVLDGTGRRTTHRDVDVHVHSALFLGDDLLLVVDENGQVETRKVVTPDRRERLITPLDKAPDQFAVSRDLSSAAAVVNGRDLVVISVNSQASPERSKLPFKASHLAISPDGSWIAITDDQGRLRAFRKRTNPNRTADVYPGQDAVNSITFASNTLVIVGERGGATYGWDLRAPKTPRKLADSSGSVDVIAISADQHAVAAASGSITPGISIRNLETGKPIGSIPGVRTVGALRFTADGRYLVSGSLSGEVRYWRLNSAGASRTIRALDFQPFPLDARLYSIVREPKRDVFLVGGDHGILQRYGSAGLEKAPTVLAERRQAALATVPDVKRFEDGGRNFLLTGHVMAIGFAQDGTRFATVDPYGFALVWNAKDDGAPPALVPSADISHAAFSVALSPFGRRLVVGATSTVTTLHELDDQDRSRTSTRLSSGGDDTVRAVVFADENTVIVGDDHGRVVRWRLGEKPISETLISEGGAVTGLLVRNGRLLIGRGDEVDSIELNGKANEVIALTKGFGSVDSLALSDDGKRLAVGYADGTIRVFATAQPSAEPVLLNVHRDIVRALVFDQAGNTLVSVGDDGMIRSTAVGEERLGALACDMLWRDLTDVEIASYFTSTLPPAIPSCPEQPP